MSWLKHLRGDGQWNKLACAYIHTFWGKCVIDDYSWQPQCYSQRYLALLITGSRLNVSNPPHDRPYCSCAWNKPRKFNTTEIFYFQLYSMINKRTWWSKLECQSQLFWKPSTCCHLLACFHCRSWYRLVLVAVAGDNIWAQLARAGARIHGQLSVDSTVGR